MKHGYVEESKDWEAECDAECLMKAEKIIKDPKRKEKAMKAMEKMMKEKKEEMKTMEDLMEM